MLLFVQKGPCTKGERSAQDGRALSPAGVAARSERSEVVEQQRHSRLGGSPGAGAVDGAGGVDLVVVGKITSDGDSILQGELDLANANLAGVRAGGGQVRDVAVGQGGVVDLEGAGVGVDVAGVDVLNLVYDEGCDELGAVEGDDVSFGSRHCDESMPTKSVVSTLSRLQRVVRLTELLKKAKLERRVRLLGLI